jgi:hypothetical protein
MRLLKVPTYGVATCSATFAPNSQKSFKKIGKKTPSP